MSRSLVLPPRSPRPQIDPDGANAASLPLVWPPLGTRAVGVAVSIVSIPLVIDYLGPERFGLWVTATAIISMLTFADLGLGNGP